MKKVGIIGSGVGGLSVACRLAAKGFEVTVFEMNAYPGGKLSEATWSGYRFDLGPSLFTMPEVIDDIFHFAQKNPRDYYNYVSLPTITKYFFEDGTQFNSYANKEIWLNELQKKICANTLSINNFLKKSKFIYENTAHIFLERSLHCPETYFRTKTLKSIINLPRLGLFRNMAQANRKTLNNPYLEQYFNRFATYNGSNPYSAPETLNLIAHIEHGKGAYFPIGGMYSITQALYKLALDLGVKFHFNQNVTQIHINKKNITGLEAGKKYYPFDIVVSNADVFNTYQNLLKIKGPEKILNQEKSSSALIFYWGIKKQFKELHLHNIFFSKNYEKEFHALFNEKTIDSDPTIYINITSKMNPTDAPEGCENWFVMVNAPHNTNQNWEHLIKITEQNIMKKLNRILGIEIEKWIEVNENLAPPGIELKTGSYLGALYGNSSNNRMAAFFRHPNFSYKINGLYFCGGTVHPGGGIPLAALSGKITTDLILKKYKKNKKLTCKFGIKIAN